MHTQYNILITCDILYTVLCSSLGYLGHIVKCCEILSAFGGACVYSIRIVETSNPGTSLLMHIKFNGHLYNGGVSFDN